ncbi:hypothetical protein E2562_002199 [Oryza meyeriana var. granulata]|uniref:Uncharacterized protein n=1 Tax=Oryza meyeriana var. granulata TaxID=110450 RepID=A0A6G1EE16_9ORYZ|nr:hypothetical protein E2562_002199 [Oryza meyeriana var. granulata]
MENPPTPAVAFCRAVATTTPLCDPAVAATVSNASVDEFMEASGTAMSTYTWILEATPLRLHCRHPEGVRQNSSK